MKYVCFLFVFLSLIQSNSLQADEIVFCTENKQQPPLLIGDSDVFDEEYPGVSVELVRIAARQVGLTPIIIRAPWRRCLMTLQSNNVDGVFNGSFKAERQKMGRYPMRDGVVDPTRRLTTISYSLYRQKGSKLDWDGTGITNLSGTIGVPMGYSIVNDLNKMGIQIEESHNTTFIFKKLQSGRVAGAAVQTLTGDALMATGQYPAIEKIERPLVTKPYYVLLSHQFVAENPEKAERLWQAIARLRETEMPRLVTKYIN